MPQGQTGQSIADVLALLRAVRSGQGELSSEAICHLTVDELCASFIAALALLSTLADAMDQQRKALGLEPIADDLLLDLARSLGD